MLSGDLKLSQFAGRTSVLRATLVFCVYAAPALTDAALHAQELNRAENPLAPVRTESPRDTMRTFIEAMNDHRRGIEKGDERLKLRIHDAVRTLNLRDVNAAVREERGREAALHLKEVIDRVIVIDYQQIPDNSGSAEPILRWRLRNTEVVISRVESGDRAGEYLFTADTVARAGEFYSRVRGLPYLPGSGGGAGYRRPWIEETTPAWMQESGFGLFWWQWIGVSATLLLALALRLTLIYALRGLEGLWRRTGRPLPNGTQALHKPLALLGSGVVWLAGLEALHFQGAALTAFVIATRLYFSAAFIWLAYCSVELLNSYLRKAAAGTESTLDDQLVPLVTRTIKIFVLTLGTLSAIQNLGVNVLSLLAGLGLGGLAFALAARDTVANFFGSLMIFFDRPFQIGDWIKVGDTEGSVEEIGFRSTRIRTFYDSLLSVPNSEIATATIDNMGRRRHRRVKTTLSLVYSTPPEKIAEFVDGIKAILRAHPAVNKEKYHVVFHDYGASGLDILVYFFLSTSDWGAELLERQNVLLRIMQLAKQQGVEFAFPTRTLHIESWPEPPPSPAPTGRNGDQE